jgi:hypothetical protein
LIGDGNIDPSALQECMADLIYYYFNKRGTGQLQNTETFFEDKIK